MPRSSEKVLREINRISRGKKTLTPLFRTKVRRFLSQKQKKVRETYLYYQIISKLFQYFLVIISYLNSLESIQEQSGWGINLSSFLLFFFSILELFQIEKRGERHREEWIKCRKDSACGLQIKKRPQQERKRFKCYLVTRNIIRITSSTLSLVEIFTTQLDLVPIFLIALVLSHNFERWCLREKKVEKKVSDLRSRWEEWDFKSPRGIEALQALTSNLGETGDLLRETFDFETDFRYLIEN